MTVVVQISPLGSAPGLIGYECPECVYVTSVLWRPRSREQGPRPQSLFRLAPAGASGFLNFSQSNE
jgi:hypothetical protein